MFTGIITHTAFLADKNNLQYTFTSSLNDVFLGESLCHGGVCLTVSRIIDQNKGVYCVDISHETMKITTAYRWNIGDSINLERSLRANSFIGGHYVTGHVDTLGYISSIKKIDNNAIFTVSSHDKFLYEYIAKKGSIAIDGVSLTINDVTKENFSICIVPYTYQKTSFKNVSCHSLVNIEYDLLAKYTVSYMENKV